VKQVADSRRILTPSALTRLYSSAIPLDWQHKRATARRHNRNESCSLKEPMTSLDNKERFLEYIYELESALSATAVRDCQGLHAETQLSAAVYALLRATSLFRASITLLDADLLDACDVVRRACWEAWMLGYEFRISSSSGHAAR
jgi:hypothetical protein